VVQGQAEVPEWVDPEKERWAALEQEQVRVENVSVPNAGLSYLMRLEFPVTKRTVPNVA
jgi:hypothetical protein